MLAAAAAKKKANAGKRKRDEQDTIPTDEEIAAYNVTVFGTGQQIQHTDACTQPVPCRLADVRGTPLFTQSCPCMSDTRVRNHVIRQNGSANYEFSVMEDIQVSEEANVLLTSITRVDAAANASPARRRAIASDSASLMACGLLGIKMNGVLVTKVEGYERNPDPKAPGFGAYDNIDGLGEKLKKSAFFNANGYAFVQKFKQGDDACAAVILYGDVADATLGCRISTVTGLVLPTNGELTFVAAVGEEKLMRGANAEIKITTTATAGLPAFGFATDEDKTQQLQTLQELRARADTPGATYKPEHQRSVCLGGCSADCL